MGRQKVNGQKMHGWRCAPIRHATNVSRWDVRSQPKGQEQCLFNKK
jgi:hypothetical protein